MTRITVNYPVVNVSLCISIIALIGSSKIINRIAKRLKHSIEH